MHTPKSILANAMGAKTARACDICLKTRARWFCPPDDAFLCHSCDLSVHSANTLAARHHRVRLDSSSKSKLKSKSKTEPINNNTTMTNNPHPPPAPAWLQGFTKKARTPRNLTNRVKQQSTRGKQIMLVVPEMSGDDEASFEEENEAQMVFSVPTFDPFDVELNNNNNNSNDHININEVGFDYGDELNNISLNDNIDDWNYDLPEFLPPDNDLAEFAADVESLLEQQQEEEEEEGDQMYAVLPLLDNDEKEKRPSSITRNNMKNEWGSVKVEEEMMESTTSCGHLDWSMEGNEMLNFEVSYHNDECGKIMMDGEEEKKLVGGIMTREIHEERLLDGDNNNNNIETNNSNKKGMKICLRLNYDEVINAWAGSSPWTTGDRPEFDLDHDGWLDSSMGLVGPFEGYHQNGEMISWRRGHVDGADGGREARVSRYREKRRTRLFSKKIRYEVRKLNAEKRPRLKGRFVKRTSLPQVSGFGPPFSNSQFNK